MTARERIMQASSMAIRQGRNEAYVALRIPVHKPGLAWRKLEPETPMLKFSLCDVIDYVHLGALVKLVEQLEGRRRWDCESDGG